MLAEHTSRCVRRLATSGGPRVPPACYPGAIVFGSDLVLESPGTPFVQARSTVHRLLVPTCSCRTYS